MARWRVRWSWVRAIAVVVAMALAATVTPVATGLVPSVGAATSPWRAPVGGPVVRGFDGPTSDYGAGHRGLDLAAAPGTVVGALGAGVVVFAGDVAGVLHVVVDHGDDLRTTVSFLATVTAHVGDRVEAGTPLGTSGGEDPATGHGGGVVHVGVRVGERYVDPATLLAPGDLTDRVRLAPVGAGADPGPWATPAPDPAGPPPGGACAVDVPVVGGLVSAVTAVACDAVEWAARTTWEAVQVGLWVVAGWDVGGREIVRHFTPVLRRMVGYAATLTAAERRWFFSQPAGKALRDLYEIGARAIAAFTQECGGDAATPGGAVAGGAPHRLMAVAGIDSSTGTDGHTFGLDLDALDVAEGDVTWFSYAEDGGAYDRSDTEGDLRDAARRLAAQLRALHELDPDRPVDVVAHSQGGVVVDWFLTHQYDRHPDRYPPLPTVVTLSSPHQGAPLATAAGSLRTSGKLRIALDLLDHLHRLPESDAPAVRQLAEGSDFMQHLWDHPLPSHLAYVSVGGTDDFVVPADRIHVEGAQEIVIAVDGPLDHSAIVDDERTMRVVRRALAGKSLPCTTFEERIRSATEPVLLSRFEDEIGPALVAFATVGS